MHRSHRYSKLSTAVFNRIHCLWYLAKLFIHVELWTLSICCDDTFENWQRRDLHLEQAVQRKLVLPHADCPDIDVLLQLRGRLLGWPQVLLHTIGFADYGYLLLDKFPIILSFGGSLHDV